MRLKKVMAIFGSIMIGLIVLMIYAAKDLTGFPSRKSSLLEDYRDVSYSLLLFFIYSPSVNNNLTMVATVFYWLMEPQ